MALMKFIYVLSKRDKMKRRRYFHAYVECEKFAWYGNVAINEIKKLGFKRCRKLDG